MKAKLYSPVFVDIWEYDEIEGDVQNELSQREAVEYADKIRDAMKKYAQPEEAERGLMEYYGEADSVDGKVQTLFLDVEIHGGKLWATAALDLTKPLTAEELDTLRDYITGQYSDGWGEGFEQQNIRVDNGELNVHLWKHGKSFIDTQEQFAQRLGISLPPDALSQDVAETWDSGESEFSEARQKLIERAGQNWDDYRNAPHDTTPDNLFHRALKVVACRDACQFIKDYDGFTLEQINCLLQFANPVDLVADYLDPKSDISEMPGILENILEEQENFKKHYALAPDPSAPTLEELEQRLRDRLDENYAVYKRDTLDMSKEEIFKTAAEIAAVAEIYEYVTEEHNFKDAEVEFLLKFQNPLEVLSDGSNAHLSEIRDTIDWVMDDQEWTLQKGGYTLMPEDSDLAPDAPAIQEPPQKTSGANEKPSVMDRIKQAAKEARERPNPPKDAPGRKKTDPEL